MTHRRGSLDIKAVPARDGARFVAMIPGIRKHLRFVFRHSPSAIRQEWIDDALAQAFVLFAHLVHRKRAHLAYATALARYAAHHVRQGGLIGLRVKRRDVTSRAAQRRFGFRLTSADQCWGQSQLPFRELLCESRYATPAEIAAIRIDLARWLSLLSGRQREIAQCLAVGDSTGLVASRFQVSPGRISQIRLELETQWRRFHREPPEPKVSENRRAGWQPNSCPTRTVRLGHDERVRGNLRQLSLVKQ